MRSHVAKKPAEEFERQIERIHRLLETETSQVTWNDRIPDPDNPNQLRQIDIKITIFFDFGRPINLTSFQSAGLQSVLASYVEIELSLKYDPGENRGT
jgi:hypothetical protein